MEKKGKTLLSRFLGLFNFFDLALLIAAALIAAVLVAMTVLNRQETVTVRYTVEVTGLENGVEKLIRKGDPVMDIIKKYDVGTIIDVEYGPTTQETVDYGTETMVEAQVPGQTTALVTIETQAVDIGRALSVEGNYDLRIGGGVSVRSPGLSFSGTIIKLQEVEDNG